MRARHGYLLLSLAGAVVPLAEFTPWLATNGLNVPLLVQELFANRVSSFFALDVLLSACSLFLFAMVEQSRWKMLPWWTPVMLTFVFGVSAGLPLLLYLLERARKEPEPLRQQLSSPVLAFAK